MVVRWIAPAVLAAAAIAGLAALTTGGGDVGPRRIVVTELPQGRRIHVVDHLPRARRIGVTLTRFSTGDEVEAVSRLADRSGRPLGRVELHCVITLPGPGNRIEQICSGVLRLRDGAVTFATATAPGATTTPAAVTGGTSAYAGARGTLATVGHTDGSATHTVTLRR